MQKLRIFFLHENKLHQLPLSIENPDVIPQQRDNTQNPHNEQVKHFHFHQKKIKAFPTTLTTTVIKTFKTR
ncbi:hypothetical protein PBAL39_12403 [Pedobacter sp. BAL39]|nr:hypothetical protein PBAL39_12403 [Pedobacter sp. BAL39]